MFFRHTCVALIVLYSNVAIAGVGTIDQRQYVDWNTFPYTRIVYFYPEPYYTCTAQYVARDIILTARHCITNDKEFDNYRERGKTFEIWTHDNRRTQVTLEQYGRNLKHGDWALLRVTDPAFYRDDTFDVSKNSISTTVTNAGFAGLRILTDAEIKTLKQIFVDVSKANNLDMRDYNNIMNVATQKIADAGIAPLEDNRVFGSAAPGDWEFKLKASKNCTISGHRSYVMTTTCDSSAGDSGGAYFSGNNIYGIVSRGIMSFEDDLRTALVNKPEQIYKALQTMKKSTPESVSQKSKPEPDNINAVQTELSDSGTKLAKAVQNVSNMSDRDFLKFLIEHVDYQELQERYERAKAREQSKANKILGAAAIGATGFGGMMALSGMAEQNADQDAERDMRAYLATFRCDYGQGRNITGGTTGIELSTAPQLMELVTEYKSVATELKSMKSALNMQPGIESETVFDSATGGLYDDVSVGAQPGAFTSLSRALQDENSADTAKWQEMKDATAKKLKTGAIVAGVGAIGGAVGNLIINKDANRNTDTQTDKNTDKTNNKTPDTLITKNNFTDDNLLIQVANTCFVTRGCESIVTTYPQTDNQRTAVDSFLEIINNKSGNYGGFNTYTGQGYKMPLNFASDLLSLRNAINNSTLDWGAHVITFNNQSYPAFLLEVEVGPTSHIDAAYKITKLNSDTEYEIATGDTDKVTEQIKKAVQPFCPICTIGDVSGRANSAPIPGESARGDNVFLVTSGNELKYVFRPMYDTRYDETSNTFQYYQYYRISKPLVK